VFVFSTIGMPTGQDFKYPVISAPLEMNPCVLSLHDMGAGVVVVVDRQLLSLYS
jgi:hypothetical protein